MALKELTSTGYVIQAKSRLLSAVLTCADDTSVVKLEIKDGSSGAVLLTLQAKSRVSVPWTCGDRRGVSFGTGIYAVLSGSGPGALASFEYHQ